MPHHVLCPCRGNPDCKLCLGTKVYTYEPTDRGWMPFPCPTCEGKKELTIDGKTEPCFTCLGAGTVDPANPPRDTSTRGFIRDVWRIFFGG
ncbi:hypothetical protein [Frigoriglobus tundricola]|uniref:Uncharacterized protein n=1 Tax=Frigoriglobus tundricola TaxID=2774151 RepID=A0A6M5YW61_9BACT|nr:hypothetical protein [Frigoriglobus tundricola]QJW97740.1 hypothetical protein FTUN_5318 [Frigoriglobus tundricola]